MQLSCEQNFHTKKSRVKCWWNWPLADPSIFNFFLSSQVSKKDSRIGSDRERTPAEKNSMGLIMLTVRKFVNQVVKKNFDEKITFCCLKINCHAEKKLTVYSFCSIFLDEEIPLFLFPVFKSTLSSATTHSNKHTLINIDAPNLV